MQDAQNVVSEFKKGTVILRHNLIAARKAKQLTQKQLAEILGINERTYQHIEAGTRKGDVEVWLKLSELLKKSIRHLLEQAPDTN